MLVDHSRIPRDTYYACPHGKDRIGGVFESETLRFANNSGNGTEEDSSGCPYYFGYLKLFSRGARIPEECLTCKRLTECMDKES
jgi:hypothetical protein